MIGSNPGLGEESVERLRVQNSTFKLPMGHAQLKFKFLIPNREIKLKQWTRGMHNWDILVRLG